MIAHPLADSFPLMSDVEYAGLVQDVKENGLRHPVITYENMILDGRNRKRACQELGIPAAEVKFEDRYPDQDPARFVASENIHRRHLTQAQLTIAAEKLATAMAGRPRKNVSADNVDEEAHQAVTVKQAAALTGAAEPSVRKVRKVRKDAVPEVQAAMDRGDLTPTAAVNLSRRSPEEQLEIMKLPISQVPTVAAAPVAPTGEAPSLNPAGGRVGPKVVLTRQMTLPDLVLIQKVVQDWAEHKDVISDLDPGEVKKFLADLRKSRTAYTRLIELIGLETKTDAPATPRGNGHGKDTDVPTEPPVKRAARAPVKAGPKKTPVAAKKAVPSGVSKSGESLIARTPAPVKDAGPTGDTLAAKAAEVAASKTTENKDA